jgi:hypothetical protein
MVNRPQIERDVHDLLDEANVMVLRGQYDPQRATDLIARLRHCAERADRAGYAESGKHLRHVGEQIEKQLTAPSR